MSLEQFSQTTQIWISHLHIYCYRVSVAAVFVRNLPLFLFLFLPSLPTPFSSALTFVDRTIETQEDEEKEEKKEKEGGR